MKAISKEMMLIYILMLKRNWKSTGYAEDYSGGFVRLLDPEDDKTIRYYLYRSEEERRYASVYANDIQINSDRGI